MTRISFAGLVVGATVLTTALAACSADKATGVEPRIGHPVVKSAITRYEPLTSVLTASATIGAEGGSFTLPGAGLTVNVPAGAVSEPTTFTATARRGSIVAYDFQPSGHFAVPLEITQDLYYTSWHHQADLTDVFAGYFTGENALDDEQGEAEVSEIPPSTVNTDSCKVTVLVSHFSGYVIATGRNRHE